MDRIISQIGCFHFGEREQERPMLALQEALGNESRLQAGSVLLVLPEAFNIPGSDYFSQQDAKSSPDDFLDSLKNLSSKYGVAFATSLIVDKRNAAFLIDGDQDFPAGNKQTNDGSHLYEKGEPKPIDPLPFLNLQVGIPICQDSTDASSPRFVDDHVSRLNPLRNTRKENLIICIPSNMRSFQARGVVEGWSNVTVALANRHAHPERPTILRVIGGRYLECADTTNSLLLADLLVNKSVSSSSV